MPSTGEICDRDVVITDPSSSVPELARLMREYHVGDVVVVDRAGGQPVPIGIVTDRDLVVQVLAAEVSPTALTAADVMSDQLVMVAEHEEVWDALETMRANGVRRVPVVDEQRALVGILALDDLLDLLAEELAHLVRLIAREQQRERQLHA
jgi:CBS domain-containing protein